MRRILPKALTIAGSDPSGGAGIQADLKTFWDFNVEGFSVVTAATAQNSSRVRGTYVLPPEFVASQIDSVASGMEIDALKTGMLAKSSIIEMVAEKISEYRLKNLVIDPIIKATDGFPLLERGGEESIKQNLFPLARAVTPNLFEAGVLAGIEVKDLPSMKEAARIIGEMGPDFVLVKGGHLRGKPVDILYGDGKFTEFSGKKIKARSIHGTGCRFSAAIAAELARGSKLHESVQRAKTYLRKVITQAGT